MDKLESGFTQIETNEIELAENLSRYGSWRCERYLNTNSFIVRIGKLNVTLAKTIFPCGEMQCKFYWNDQYNFTKRDCE
jgi:hypothetical protein